MRRKIFLVTLVLVLALTMALPIQAMAATTCPGTTTGTVYYRIVTSGSNGTTCTKPSTAVAKYNDYGSTVYEIETMLSKLGYSVGVVNKYYDYNTMVAVYKFQKANGLPGTGTVDQTTYQKLKTLYAAKIGSGNTTPPSGGTTTPPSTGGGTTTPPSSGGGTTTPPSTSGLTAEEQQMINLVNQERTSRGLKALQVDMTLVKTARMKSQDMITNNYFAHQSPTYGSPFDLMKSQGVSYRYAGENLAGAGSVTSAHTNLMNSSGHRANILNVNFTHIGIGIVHGGRYGIMFTQHFIGK